MYTHSPDPSKQYAILRKIRGSRDQAIPGYFAPQEQIPWVRGCSNPRETGSLLAFYILGEFLNFQGVPMSIALNSQKHDSSYACQQWTIPVVGLCISTKYKASIHSYFALTL
jgi:hypothetical protein